MHDIRWIQRLSNYSNALSQFKAAVDLFNSSPLSDLEKQGIIKSFEYTHELAWNCMKDYFEYQGNTNIRGSRDATREAFKVSLIKDGEIWMEMIQTRNLTTHAYDKSMAEQVIGDITGRYAPLFLEFEKIMLSIKDDELREVQK